VSLRFQWLVGCAILLGSARSTLAADAVRLVSLEGRVEPASRLPAVFGNHEERLNYELVWLDTTHGYTISHIPLRFDIDPSIQARVKSLKGFPRESNAVSQPELDPFPVQMATTDAGICLYHPSAGIWFIPYPDIDTYLNSVQK
jgi:hypothetical protein